MPLCSFRCSTATHWGGSASCHRSHCYSLVWISIFPRVPLLLTVIAPHHLRCLISSNLGHFMQFQVFHFCSLTWHCITPGVTLLQTGWTCMVSSVTLLFTWEVLDGLKCHNAAYFGDSVSSQVSHCHSHLLGWLCIISGVELPLTRVALCHSRCLTATNWGCSIWSKCISLGQLCVPPGILLP